MNKLCALCYLYKSNSHVPGTVYTVRLTRTRPVHGFGIFGDRENTPKLDLAEFPVAIMHGILYGSTSASATVLYGVYNMGRMHFVRCGDLV